MKFFYDDNNKVMVQPITSSTAFLSSLTGVIKKRMLGMFKKDYFKHIYVDTSETFQEHNKSMLMNKHLSKIEYPSLTISPQLSLDQPVGGMNTLSMSDPNFFVHRDYRYYYPTLLEEPNGKYGIYFASRYRTFNLKFTIVTDSFDQSTEIGHYLDSRFNDETFKFMSNQIIQCEVPKTFVNAIAQIEGLFTSDIDDKYNNQDDLNKLDMLFAQLGRRHSTIVRKRSISDNKMGYFYEEKKNLLTLWTDLDMPEGIIRDNNVNGEYEISFRVQVSCWWPSAYIMSINTNAYKTVSRLFDGITSTIDLTGTNYYSTSIGEPISLDRKDSIYFTSSDKETNVGICVFHETLNFVASKNSEFKTFNCAEYLWDNPYGEQLKKVHAYCLDCNVNPDKLLYIVARSANNGSAFVGTINYETFDITFPSAIDTDIVLDIFVNRALFDSLGHELMSHPFYSKKTAMTYMDITTAIPYIASNGDTEYKGITQRLRIYLFEREEDMETNEIEKSLRVKTPYGIGYVGLVGEGDRMASNLKICLGKNNYGNDIIRCFESE